MGEAGIGKSIEFELEVDRLNRAGKPAFLIPLNQLVDTESWQRTLADSHTQFLKWKSSTETAYFLLDSVDEARLTSHADFETAISIVRQELHGNFDRVRVVISSRPSDWSLDGVQSSIAKHFGASIANARTTSASDLASDLRTDEVTVNFDGPSKLEPITPFVAELCALSVSEQRLADHFGVQEPGAFWEAVFDGHYAFMATRPLDLDGWFNIGMKRSVSVPSVS